MTNTEQRLRHLPAGSAITLKKFKNIRLLKNMKNEIYYVTTTNTKSYNWGGDWTYIEANAYYEEEVIKRINITQELIAKITSMSLRDSENRLILPYVNEFVDISIPKLNIIISNINKYSCIVEYAGIETEHFENKTICINELEDILSYVNKKINFKR